MQYINLADSIHVQATNEGSGSLATGAIREDGFMLFLMEGDCRANGENLDRNSAFLIPSGTEFCVSNDRAVHWMTLFVPLAAAEATEMMLPPFDIIGNSPRVILPSRGATDRLRSCIKRFVVGAQAEPSLLQQVAPVTSFRDVLADYMRDWLFIDAAKSERRTGRPPTVDGKLIATAVELIEDSPEPILALEELVAALGVSKRSVQTGFRDYLGVSPRRYMDLCRLHRARRQLVAGSLPEATVTKVATELGMWDFGRFAARYRALFGERPSETLRCRER